MRAVVQRVQSASVEVGGAEIARIGRGLLALVAIHREDRRRDLEWMARKIVELRVFEDAGGELLVVSQFTLYGDCRKGRRPSYIDAAPPVEAERLYSEFVRIVRGLVPAASDGKFQARMEVALVNSGPVTLILDSRSL